jgi:hypothetical protein
VQYYFIFSHEFFLNVPIFFISLIRFFDDPSYMFTNNLMSNEQVKIALTQIFGIGL